MVIGSQPNLKKIVHTASFSIGDSVIDLIKNVSRAIGFLKHAKKFVPKETLIQMYRGIVEPNFRLCCSMLGGCGETRLRALQKLQSQAARIVRFLILYF